MNRGTVLYALLGQDITADDRPLTSSDLDDLLPSEGYAVVDPPAGYVQARKPGSIPGVPLVAGPEASLITSEIDHALFGALLQPADETRLDSDERTHRRMLKLLLQAKNGTPFRREEAATELVENARECTTKELLETLLRLVLSLDLMQEDGRRMASLMEGVILRLDDEIRPFTRPLLIAFAPLLLAQLVSEVEIGTSLVGSVAKAAGVAAVIASLRPLFDDSDSLLRLQVAYVLAVVADSLGLESMLPLLRVISLGGDKFSWQARSTALKTIGRTGRLFRSGILPHLPSLIDMATAGLSDEQDDICRDSALALGALATAVPSGQECFVPLVPVLWQCVAKRGGRTRLALLQSVASLLPQLPPDLATTSAKDLLAISTAEFQTTEAAHRAAMSTVLFRCLSSASVDSALLSPTLVSRFFDLAWGQQQMTRSPDYFDQLVETTAVIAQRLGADAVLSHLARLTQKGGNDSWYSHLVTRATARVTSQPRPAEPQTLPQEERNQ